MAVTGAAAAAALLVAGTALAQPRPPGPVQGEIRPDLIYRNYCSVCHGDRGDGRSRARNSLNPPPADFTSAQARASFSRERMILALNHGRPGTAMTAWTTQLSQKEIEAVVDYIRATMMASAPAADPSAALPGALAGNAGRGKRLYVQNCVACHGTKGDGNGPRAALLGAKPRDFGDGTRGLNRPALYAAIAGGKTGTDMPAWSAVFDRQRIADVAEYVWRSYFAPPRSAKGGS
jgi:cbb3-type cytochrome c oxidase subunit III